MTIDTSVTSLASTWSYSSDGIEAYDAGYGPLKYPSISGCAYNVHNADIVQSNTYLGDDDDGVTMVHVEYPDRNSMKTGDKDSMTITFYDAAGHTVATY